MTQTKSVYKSKYGYHSCSYETFKKIKALRKRYFEAQRQAANWYRWARKQEHNRRGSEPSIDPLFCEKVLLCKKPYRQLMKHNEKLGYKTSYRTPSTTWVESHSSEAYMYKIPGTYKIEIGSYYPVRDKDNHDYTVVVRDHGVLKSFEQARMPQETAAMVEKLILNENKIDILLSKIKK